MAAQTWQAWWEQAQDDVRTFEILATSRQYAAACFFAQQAGEKAVKAVMVSRNLRPWGYSVMHLLPAAGSGAPVDAGKRLDFYYVPTRYPDAFPEGSASEHFTADDVLQARAAMGEVVTWASTQLPGPDGGPTL